MIDDPIPWRDELVTVARRLEAKTKQKRWAYRTDYRIERDFVLSAHAMRRLIESHAVPDKLRQRQIPVRRFELRGTAPDPRGPADIAESYDIEHGRRSALSVAELCREILHSVVFAFCCGETDDLFDGIYVSSDRHKNDHVYLVLASDFIALCCDIGTADAQPR